jgi:hypothetical protein
MHLTRRSDEACADLERGEMSGEQNDASTGCRQSIENIDSLETYQLQQFFGW